MVIVVVLAAAGLALALVQFGRPSLNGTILTPGRTTTYTKACGPPIVSAWQRESFEGGWFGYAPLTKNPSMTPLALPYCRPGARNRLALAVGLWFAAALVLLLTRRPRATTPRIAPA